jgi:hypothetical protein
MYEEDVVVRSHHMERAVAGGAEVREDPSADPYNYHHRRASPRQQLNRFVPCINLCI